MTVSHLQSHRVILTQHYKYLDLHLYSWLQFNLFSLVHGYINCQLSYTLTLRAIVVLTEVQAVEVEF